MEPFQDKRAPADDSSLSPNVDKPRLGKFLDFYSREHLNVTPETVNKKSLELDKNAFTPNFHELNQLCRTDKIHAFYKEAAYDSFEGNQSFPRLKRNIRPFRMELEAPCKVKPAADLVRVDGPNGLRFNTSLGPNDASGCSLHSQAGLQQAVTNTKAVFTIEPDTTKILIVNNKACSLLGYTSAEICGSMFRDYIHCKKRITLKVQNDGDSNEDGTIVLMSGKVVELVTKDGGTVQVSLWIRQLDNDGPCLVVAEQVCCKSIVFTIDWESGTIMFVDNEDAALLFQADAANKLIGLPIISLIPSLRLPQSKSELPSELQKQKLTGRTLDGGCFPLNVIISKVENSENKSSNMYKDNNLLEIHIRVTLNVSGLLVIDDGGIITACNDHFAKLTFGKSNSDIVGHYIEEVLPNFCKDTELVKPTSRSEGNTMLSLVHNDDETTSDTEDDSCEAFNGSQKSACISNVQPSSLTKEKSSSALCLDKSNSIITHTPTPTQDMVSSFSTEQRIDIPDVTSGMSGISIDEDPYSSISKSRSENMLKTDSQGKGVANREDLTPTGNLNASNPSNRLSLDSSKYRSLKLNLKDDRTSLSVDFCDSNETSADFLTPINEMPSSYVAGLKQNGSESMESLSNMDLETQTESAPKHRFDEDIPVTPCVSKKPIHTQLTTSTPHRASHRESHLDYLAQSVDGTYKGVILHKDGTELNVLYTVSSMVLSNGLRVRCVWLGVREDARPTLTSSLASTGDDSLAMGIKSVSSRPHSMSMSQCGEEQISGEYNKHYVTLKQIGKGSYGCVKLVYRRCDRLLCVAKFILKEKVGVNFWVDGPEGKKIPLELSLLMTIKHPHIVSVLEMYENEKYFQMIMERHGSGMDLFEFIERRPRLDEPLLSLIFRQIGQAIEYLHSLNILHRDIKDENIIIDNKFHVKLIDFGSATFMSKGTLFSTFYGTAEYCSPEVLAGNKYAGPELEMWSMGITLYVLTFFINPFSDIEDTIQGTLSFPQAVSEDLEQLIRWMLCKDPTQRCTIPQLMDHPWIKQNVSLSNYVFSEIVDCEKHEANPELYYSGSYCSTKSESQLSLLEQKAEAAVRSDGRLNQTDAKRSSQALMATSGDKDVHSDNYSLRSSADILDISSKPISDALTDISSDATGHAACDIDYDCDQYECDSWDECEQDSFS